MSNDPIVLYNNALALASTVSPDGETVIDDDTTQRWFPADTDAIEFTGFPEGEITHIGIAAHSLGTSGASLVVEYFDGSWNALTTITRSDDTALLEAVGPVTATGLRFTADGSELNVGIIYAGSVMTFERRFYQGHTPIRFGDQNNRFITRTNGGQFVGNRLRRRSKATSISVDNLTPGFVRFVLEPFRQHYNDGGRFFFSWRPETFPDEAVYAKGEGVMSPTNSGPAALMSADFALVAYVQLYRQDLITPPGPAPEPDLWTPAEITTALWLDADDSGTIQDTPSALTWADKSGNGRDASQDASRPSVGSGFISFSGSQYLDISGGLPVLDGLSVFEVFDRPSSTGFSLIMGGTRSSEPPYTTFWETDSTIYTGLGTTGFTTHGVSTSTGTVMHSIVRDASSCQLWQDGFSVGSPQSALTNSGVYDLAYVGRRASNYNSGNIREIVVVPASLSSADRQRIEGYLAWKWGLEGKLPSGHPYKNEAPTV